MLRVFVIIGTVAVCIGAGATAGLPAFASEFGWPLSDANFSYSARLGVYWGLAGGIIGAGFLARVDRKYLWTGAVITVVLTWLITFVAVWWHMISGLE